MPHQCVKCGNLYDDGEADLLNGCTCGAKLFFYISQERMQKIKEEGSMQLHLSKTQQKQIEKDVIDLIGEEFDKEKPIILDFESIKILKPGTYELDLVNLFNKKQPLIYKLEDGKYFIDIKESLKRK